MVRDWWIKKLHRIITDIEAGKTPVPIREVYVCGAFARGELDPAELILIVIHDELSSELITQYQLKQPSRSIVSALTSGIQQFERHLLKVLRRPTERIEIHHGTSLELAYFPTSPRLKGLVFLWSPLDRDWRGKLAAIPIPEALSAAPPFAINIPDAVREEAEYLSQLVTLKQIRLQRIPFESLPPLSMEAASGFLAAPAHLDYWGVHTKPLFPLACAWLSTQGVWKAMATDGCLVYDHDFRFRVQVGKPHFRKMLMHFDRPGLEQQCYIPFLKRGYPKEVFIFERGTAWQPTSVA